MTVITTTCDINPYLLPCLLEGPPVLVLLTSPDLLVPPPDVSRSPHTPSQPWEMKTQIQKARLMWRVMTTSRLTLTSTTSMRFLFQRCRLCGESGHRRDTQDLRKSANYLAKMQLAVLPQTDPIPQVDTTHNPPHVCRHHLQSRCDTLFALRYCSAYFLPPSCLTLYSRPFGSPIVAIAQALTVHPRPPASSSTVRVLSSALAAQDVNYFNLLTIQVSNKSAYSCQRGCAAPGADCSRSQHGGWLFPTTHTVVQ